METFNQINLINFFSKADLTNEKTKAKAKAFLEDKQTLVYLLENISLFPNLSASELFKLSLYTGDKDIAYLAISKDAQCLKHLKKHLYLNREFMRKIASISKGYGIYYTDTVISDDEEIMETYIFEILMSEEFENFPDKLPGLIKNKTYQKILKKISLDKEIKNSIIEYARHKESQFYNAAKAFGKKNIEPKEQALLDRLDKKINFLTKTAMSFVLNEECEPNS